MIEKTCCVKQEAPNNTSCANETKKRVVLYAIKCEKIKKQEKIYFNDFPLIKTYML
jgi:hypothetical protein